MMFRNHAPVFAVAIVLLAGLLILPEPAAATAFCQLKETRDGFVALRSGPGPSTKLVGRMKAKDEVLLGENRKGDWIPVTWWRGDDRLAKGHEKSAGRGWVHRGLVAEECG
jgi:hypothetical protein